MLELTTNNEDETREFGRRLGSQLREPTVIGLSGALGAGKTRLVQGIGLGLGIPADSITSPTFTLCVPYHGRLTLLHLDAYRIKHHSEIDELGLDEWVDAGAVLVIEWYERFGDYFPPIDMQISIELCDGDCRRIQIHSRRE